MNRRATTRPLAILRVPLADLHQDPANARQHGGRNLSAIRASLERFGQAEPLVVQGSTGRVIGGNGRLEVMRDLGWADCDVVEVDVDELEATALGIALNRSGDLADWDLPALGSLLEALKSEDALEGVGFDTEEIDELLAELHQVGDENDVEDPGAAEPPEEPVARPGDLWVLGRHKLLCGDSTSPQDLVRLMGGEKARLLSTDPPYLVDYRGRGRLEEPKEDGVVPDGHWDDFDGDDAGLEFYVSFLNACLGQCIRRVPVYQWHASRRQALVERAWKEVGLLVHLPIIWVKARGVMTRSHYLWRHEPCFYGWRKGKMPFKAARPSPSLTTVWEIDQAGEAREAHPTQKPLRIFEAPIEEHTRPGDVVLEPFSGSGTQLIAAERLGRRCMAMEKEPAYVDVAIQRWEKATGKDAVHEGTGETFSERSAS